MTERNRKSPIRPRAVMIHSLNQARAACLAARAAGVALELHSAPDAAASMGPPWFHKILRHIENEFGDVPVEGVLDCGDAAGLALAALRQGLKRLRLSGPKGTVDRIRDIARRQNATVETGWPDMLDLNGEADPDAACAAWFATPDRTP